MASFIDPTSISVASFIDSRLENASQDLLVGMKREHFFFPIEGDKARNLSL